MNIQKIENNYNLSSFIEELSETKSQLKVTCSESIADILTMSFLKYNSNYSPSLSVIGIKSQSIKTLTSNPVGIVEDIFTLIGNIKNLKFLLNSEILKNYAEEFVVTITADEAKPITVADIKSSGIVVSNNDEDIICHTSQACSIELLLAVGCGYNAPNQNENIFHCFEKGFLTLDTNFSRNIKIVTNYKEGTTKENGNLTIELESLNGTLSKEILLQGISFGFKIFESLKSNYEIETIYVKKAEEQQILSLELLKKQGYLPQSIFRKLSEQKIYEIGDLSLFSEFELQNAENPLTEREIFFIKQLLGRYNLELIVDKENNKIIDIPNEENIDNE